MDPLGSGEILNGSSQKGEQTIPFTAVCMTIPQRMQKAVSPTPHREVSLEGHSLWLEALL